MKRILCALLAVMVLLILPSCSAVPQGDEEDALSTEQSSSKAEVQAAENPIVGDAHYDIKYIHPILGDLLGTVSVDIEYSYDFANSKITDYKIKSDMEDGYSSSVIVDKHPNYVDVVMTCTEDESGDVLSKHQVRYIVREDGAISNIPDIKILEESQQ